MTLGVTFWLAATPERLPTALLVVFFVSLALIILVFVAGAIQARRRDRRQTPCDDC